LRVPAVAICSNTVTEEQADKLAALAREFGGDTVSVMFDLDREGENGAKQAVVELARRCRVRYAWTASMDTCRIPGQQPESITKEHFDAILRLHLRNYGLPGTK
jgi:hypothetical protein